MKIDGFPENFKSTLPHIQHSRFRYDKRIKEGRPVLIKVNNELGLGRYQKGKPFFLVPYQAVNGESEVIENISSNLIGTLLTGVLENAES